MRKALILIEVKSRSEASRAMIRNFDLDDFELILSRNGETGKGLEGS